ncbi:hypothetical protein DVS28_a0437 [Euzebya pacifica]|uniref:Uncharacterized protein n=1 Tax=Euzebya pacifica TaxID=1608957 RepID=A0A346XSE7_9ACTN|nr:hypothetical protein DVS28_a0437 [Euzebya pacifica]
MWAHLWRSGSDCGTRCRTTSTACDPMVFQPHVESYPPFRPSFGAQTD